MVSATHASRSHGTAASRRIAASSVAPVAAGYERSARWSDRLRTRQRAIQLVGGGFLLLVGVLLVTGVWESLNRWVQSNWLAGFEVAF